MAAIGVEAPGTNTQKKVEQKRGVDLDTSFTREETNTLRRTPLPEKFNLVHIKRSKGTLTANSGEKRKSKAVDQPDTTKKSGSKRPASLSCKKEKRKASRKNRKGMRVVYQSERIRNRTAHSQTFCLEKWTWGLHYRQLQAKKEKKGEDSTSWLCIIPSKKDSAPPK